MKRAAGAVVPALAVLVGLSGACGDNVHLGPDPPLDGGPAGETGASVVTSGLANLLAGDPLRYTYDFVHADYGYATTNNAQIMSPGPQIEYSHYHSGELSVAYLGGEVGGILDLGTDAEVAAGLGIDETVDEGEGYKNLALTAGQLNLQNAQALVDSPASALTTEAHALPGQGHVYVLRVVDQGFSLDIVVKLLIVSLSDKNDVSFEWTRLR